jgi:hypothetical protein
VVRSYDGPAHLDDVGRCVAVWENGGQIYIYAAGTRETSANGDNMDWVVLKNKADGSLDENGWPGGTGFEQSYAPTNAVVLKGQYNAGTLKSLRQDDWDYWVQEAGYDPSDPLAVINSALLCETEAANPAYGSGKVKVVEHTYTEKAKFRMRAIKADGSYVVLADNVPSGFQDVVIERDFPQPVSDFIDEANQNRLRLELRCASSNRSAGFLKHYIDLVEWVLTP